MESESDATKEEQTDTETDWQTDRDRDRDWLTGCLTVKMDWWTGLAYVQCESLEAADGWHGGCGCGSDWDAVATAARQLAVQVLRQPLHVTNVFDDADAVVDVLLFVGLWLVLEGCVPIMRGRPFGHVRAGQADGAMQAPSTCEQGHQLNAPALSVGSADIAGHCAGRSTAHSTVATGHAWTELNGLTLLRRRS